MSEYTFTDKEYESRMIEEYNNYYLPLYEKNKHYKGVVKMTLGEFTVNREILRETVNRANKDYERRQKREEEEEEEEEEEDSEEELQHALCYGCMKAYHEKDEYDNTGHCSEECYQNEVLLQEQKKRRQDITLEEEKEEEEEEKEHGGSNDTCEACGVTKRSIFTNRDGLLMCYICEKKDWPGRRGMLS